MSINMLQSEDKLFWGIISSNFAKEPNVFLKKQIKKLLGNGGALIYVYSKKFQKTDEMDFRGRWGLDQSVKDSQILTICLEEKLLVNGKLDLEKAFRLHEKNIKKLRNEGHEQIMIYTTRGQFWVSKINDNELFRFHTKLKDLAIEKNVVTAIRYIIDDFNEESFLKLISLHDLFIFDDSEGKEVYTYSELMKNAIISLSRKDLAKEEYEKGLKRMENLKIISCFSEGLAHDVNNLLATITGYAQIGLLKESQEEVKEYLSVIYRTALDAKAIINKMRNFVSGSYDSVKGLYKINDLVRESLDMAKHRIAMNKNIKVVKDFKSTGQIYCNEYEIRQVILNLILNALDSIGEQGILTIKTYDLENKVVVEIMDTGIGMDNKVMEKIFEPYFTTKGDNGTGLGLNISKKILEEHLAKIEVESEKGEGSKFSISFPVDEYWEEENVILDSSAKVLVISDNYIDSYHISELLSLLNMEVYVVEVLEEAILEKISEQKIDLMIAIYNTTNIVGINLVKKIKEKHPKIPLMLAVDNAKKVEKGLLKTADYIIKKNCSIDQLSEGINKSLGYVDSQKNKSYNIS